jgi:hypothetical protein
VSADKRGQVQVSKVAEACCSTADASDADSTNRTGERMHPPGSLFCRLRELDRDFHMADAVDRGQVAPLSTQGRGGQSSPAPHGVHLRVREIAEADREGVARLLAKGFHRPVWYYSRALERLSRHPTPVGRSKYGFLMEADGVPVGAVLLIFSTIRSGANSHTRCNVTSWYVEPAYKNYAAIFTSRALRHKDVTYINISARPAARPVIKAQGFQSYSFGQYVAIPALHLGRTEGPVRICGIDTIPDVRFETTDMELLSAHAGYGCLSLWCMTADRAYPFVVLPRVFKRLLPGAQLIYCRDIEDVVRFAGPLGRFLALRGMPVVSIDANGPVAGLIGRYIEGKSPRFFKGPAPPRLGDISYTQAAMFPWP